MRFIFQLLLILIPIFSLASEISVTRESRYISEGRDNLQNGGIYTLQASHAVNNTGIGIWTATGTEDDYDEGNAWVDFTLRFDSLELIPSYTFLAFSNNSANDHEFGLSLVWNSDEDSGADIAYVYSNEADGSFWEASIWQNFRFYQSLTLSPYFAVGINSGYINNEHRGFNNSVFGLNVEYSIGRHLVLTAHAAYSRALNRKSGESLENESWTGIGLVFDLP